MSSSIGATRYLLSELLGTAEAVLLLSIHSLFRKLSEAMEHSGVANMVIIEMVAMVLSVPW